MLLSVALAVIKTVVKSCQTENHGGAAPMCCVDEGRVAADSVLFCLFQINLCLASQISRAECEIIISRAALSFSF